VEAEKGTDEAYADYLKDAFMNYSSFNTTVNDEKRYWYTVLYEQRNGVTVVHWLLRKQMCIASYLST